MTTTSKAGAHEADATQRDKAKRDEPELPVQGVTAGARVTQPLAAISPDAVEHSADSEDEAATVMRQSVRPEAPSRPRKNTLAMAITRPVRHDDSAPGATPPSGVATSRRAGETPPGGVVSQPASAALDAATPNEPAALASDDLASDDLASDDLASDDLAEDDGDVIDEVDGWAVADQPTVYLSPRTRHTSRPAFLETGEGNSWPPRPARAVTPRPQPVARTQTPARPAAPQELAVPPRADGPRLASPAGRVMPGTPPAGVPHAALPNPRMERFQELRGQLEASVGHDRLHQEQRPVADVVRRWWHDLLPGLEGALHYQREAKASGIHPIPAYAPETTSRLGDAFGRVAASARDLTGRAQAVAAPALKRLHAHAEQAAQALVDKIEGSPARQQFPLLGPGRIAVFFKQGVTVGQAQKLLAASQARPIRLIPRKHGFLTLVPPGVEVEVAERLRVHPYVRDVAYLEYDEYGQPVRPAR
ncbi:MAG TPA: hypothetical protein VKQ30_22085 [Ktedonobacterales bacterium]|nr:hypothetical protein [Ktedonobacterales bacterium]